MSKRSHRATALVAALLLPVGFALATSSPASAQATPAATGNFAVAPYVDMTISTESLLNTAITSHGLKAYTAAFIIGEGCTNIWGDTEPIGHDPFIDPEIAKARSEGASLIISSGGADGFSLPWTCTNQNTIVSAYQTVINAYSVSRLDFDIEGAAVADPTSAGRLFTAMKTLQSRNSGLQFSVTLPVLPTGLTADGVNILKAAQKVGVKIPIVNIMAMDYNQGNQNMGTAAINAAKATLAQMKSVNSGYTFANLGITPMIGVNDDGSTFTLANAKSVESFAKSSGVGRLALWSVTRDQSCGAAAAVAASPTCSGVSQSQLAFTSAFVPF